MTLEYLEIMEDVKKMENEKCEEEKELFSTEEAAEVV